MAKTTGGSKSGADKPETAAAPKRGRLKLAGGALALALLIGGGTWFALGRGGQAAATAPERKPVAFVDIKEMTVNLATEPNQERPRFLRLKVALEVKDPKLVSDVQPLLPRVEDIFQVFVRELRASDLEGSGGVHRLREELLRRVNLAVAPSKVDAVLFKEVVIQ